MRSSAWGLWLTDLPDKAALGLMVAARPSAPARPPPPRGWHRGAGCLGRDRLRYILADMIVLVGILLSQALLEEHWQRFPVGTKSHYDLKTTDGKPPSWTETITLSSAGDRKFPRAVDSRYPDDEVAIVIQKKTLGAYLKSFEEVSREKTNIEVDGRVLAGTRTSFSQGNKEVSVSASADFKALNRQAFQAVLLPANVASVEFQDKAGERVENWRFRVASLKRDVTLNDQNLTCVVEEVLHEVKGTDADFVIRGTRFWCGSTPGALVSEEYSIKKPDGTIIKESRVLRSFEVPK